VYRGIRPEKRGIRAVGDGVDLWKEKGITEAECEECGNFNMLQIIDGRLICDSCRESM
jgi:Zn ribbon nucleic-acid-binding protein